MRYERGVDGNPIEGISQAAAALLAEVSGGTVRPGAVDVWPVHVEPVELSFRLGRFDAMMGAQIPADFVRDILRRLGCEVRATAEALYQHPNTVRYRLRRIREELALPDVSDRELAALLVLAYSMTD